jgi:parallel beta-helix repeat protein
MNKYLIIPACLVLMITLSGRTFGQNENMPKAKRGSKKSETSQAVPNKYLDIRDFYDPASPTAGLQEAINSLKPGGGTIFLSPGTYKVRRSVVPFSGVTITGSGEHSVIVRMDSCVQQPLLTAGKEGDTEIRVNDVTGFYKGGEVTVFSNKFSGFNCTSAVIVEVKEQSLVLDRPLRKNYAPEDRAGVMNIFPVFTMWKGEKVRLENFTIDGGMRPGSSYSNQFVCSAIHLVHVHNILIDKVVIRRFPSDAFSIQGGSNASVTNCLAEYNLGNGFHPGTTLTGSTWSRNTGRYNGGDGLYFCFNVRYASVAENHFHDNKNHGIGDLGKGGDYGDQMNVVSGNYCYNNGRAGIECTPGGNNIVVNNICENNSRAEPGRWPAISLRDTHSSIIQGNRCVESDPPSSGRKRNHGITLAGKCENNMITGNIITGYSVGIDGDNLDKNTIVQNTILEKHQPEDPGK